MLSLRITVWDIDDSDGARDHGHRKVKINPHPNLPPENGPGGRSNGNGGRTRGDVPTVWCLVMMIVVK